MIAGGLVGFVLTSAAVIARRSYGYAEGNKIQTIEKEQIRLESERARLEALVRDASSRPRLGPIAERRLGMKVPSETQVVILPRSMRVGGTP